MSFHGIMTEVVYSPAIRIKKEMERVNTPGRPISHQDPTPLLLIMTGFSTLIDSFFELLTFGIPFLLS